MIYCIDHYHSPLGGMTMAGDEERQKLVGLWFDGQKYDRLLLNGKGIQEKKIQEKVIPVFNVTKYWLDLYFQGKNPGFTPPIEIIGSEFRRMVASVMLSIPYGKTMTYGKIAALMAKEMGRESMSAQAVGGAVGHNQISLIVPCHRVLGANGHLIGYAGGTDRKRWLLNKEGISINE